MKSTKKTPAERATELERKAKEIRDKEAKQKEIRDLKTQLAKLRTPKGGKGARK